MADDRLMMEGRLIQLEREQCTLGLKIEGLCASLRTQLNIALIPIEELEMGQITGQSQELSIAHATLIGISSRISRLKKELGRG